MSQSRNPIFPSYTRAFGPTGGESSDDSPSGFRHTAARALERPTTRGHTGQHSSDYEGYESKHSDSGRSVGLVQGMRYGTNPHIDPPKVVHNKKQEQGRKGNKTTVSQNQKLPGTIIVDENAGGQPGKSQVASKTTKKVAKHSLLRRPFHIRYVKRLVYEPTYLQRNHRPMWDTEFGFMQDLVTYGYEETRLVTVHKQPSHYVRSSNAMRDIIFGSYGDEPRNRIRKGVVIVEEGHWSYVTREIRDGEVIVRPVHRALIKNPHLGLADVWDMVPHLHYFDIDPFADDPADKLGYPTRTSKWSNDPRSTHVTGFKKFVANIKRAIIWRTDVPRSEFDVPADGVSITHETNSSRSLPVSYMFGLFKVEDPDRIAIRRNMYALDFKFYGIVDVEVYPKYLEHLMKEFSARTPDEHLIQYMKSYSSKQLKNVEYEFDVLRCTIECAFQVLQVKWTESNSAVGALTKRSVPKIEQRVN